MRPAVKILVSAFLLITLAPVFDLWAPGQGKAVRGVEGIPFPASPPVYCQPVTRPAMIIQGNEGSFSHNQPSTLYAWDYEVPLGTPVAAARAGMVFYVRCDSRIGGTGKDQFWNEANVIVIDHLDGTQGHYIHLEKDSALVRMGEYVIQGEWLARSGDTGYALAPHLHFAVIRGATGSCLPVTFSDFEKNGGRPAEGDRVPEAAPPAVPQGVLSSYKESFRACRRAEELGLADLAWIFAERCNPDGRYPDYFYDLVLKKKEKIFRRGLMDRLDFFMAKEEQDPQDMPELLRFVETLAKADDEAVESRLSELKNKLSSLDGRKARSWKREKRALRDWTAGLEMECLGNTSRALEHYLAALKRQQGLLREHILGTLRMFIRHHHAEFTHALARLAGEIDIAESLHRSRIMEDASKIWKECRKLLDAWILYFPEDRERARALLDRARTDYERVAKYRDR